MGTWEIMVDKYLTYWEITTPNEKQVMRFLTPEKNSVVMVDSDCIGIPVQLNTKRDCTLLVRSMGQSEDDFLFREKIGQATKF